MIDLTELKAELDAGHPVTGAYSVDTHAAMREMNAINRTRSKSTISASILFESIDITEYEALGAIDKNHIQLILGLGDRIEIGPTTRTRAILTGAFGPGTNSRTNIIAVITEDCSRAVELWGERVRGQWIIDARALP